MYCPINQTFEIEGNIFSQKYKYLDIVVSRCKNGTNVVCKSSQEIESKIKTSEFLFGIVNKYFDFEDYTTPVKSFIENKYGFLLTPGIHK